MPEGDTIHHAANRIRSVLLEQVPERIATPHPRHRADRWPERLHGLPVSRVEAHGKHLFLHFGERLVLHSHLRMTGAWGVYRRGQRWHRAARRAWLVIEHAEDVVVQFDGPLLELITPSRRRFDPRLAELGPDIIGERFDARDVLARLRADDPTRPVGDALLDQRTLAGVGNIWKSESCFAAAVDPWRQLAEVSDAQLSAIIAFAREHMAQSARDGFEARPRAVYGRGGEPCPRCGARLRAAGQGEANRTTFWCARCQR